MNKEIISNKEAIELLILFLCGSSLVLGTGTTAGSDMWMAILFALIFALPLVLVYSRLLSLFPGKNLFDILNILLGKIFGKLFTLFFIWYAFHLGALVMRNFGEYIITVGLPDTPKMVPMIFFGLLTLWGAKAGIEVLGRCAGIFLKALIIFKIIDTSLVSPRMQLSNLLPILGNGIKPLLMGTFQSFSFPFAESVIFLMIFSCLQSKNSSYKVFTKGLVYTSIIILVVSTRNLLVLGQEKIKDVYFPSYMVVSLIRIGDFIQRLEILVSTIVILCGFIKIVICIMAVSIGIAKLFECKDYRFVVTPVSLLMLNFSYFVYDNIMQMFYWAAEIYPYYALLFQVILPVIIWIFAEAKIRLKQNLNS